MKAVTKKNRPAPPHDLDGEALLEWDRICKELEAAGKLATEHRAIITTYVETWAVYRDATRAMNSSKGAVIKYPNKMVGPSPFYKVQREMAILLRGLLTDLGLTPAAKGKTGTDDEELDIDLT